MKEKNTAKGGGGGKPKRGEIKLKYREKVLEREIKKIVQKYSFGRRERERSRKKMLIQKIVATVLQRKKEREGKY